jgi:hypothetical protein
VLGRSFLVNTSRQAPLDSEGHFRGDTRCHVRLLLPAARRADGAYVSGVLDPDVGSRSGHTEGTVDSAGPRTRLEMVTFRFCPDPICDTVYVSDTGQVFRVNDVRVPVWQKLPPGDRTLCYCFGENERDLQREITERGTTDVLARVRAHIAERRCACDVRNPRGACCLGDLTVAVAALQTQGEGER